MDGRGGRARRRVVTRNVPATMACGIAAIWTLRHAF